jgi:hypothetical protein
LLSQGEEEDEGFLLALGAFLDARLPASVSGRELRGEPLLNELGEIAREQVVGVDPALRATDMKSDLVAGQESDEAGEGALGVSPIQVRLLSHAFEELRSCIENWHTLIPC